MLNTDAHAKNYSLMLSGGEVTLAPMYDVLSIAAFLALDEHPLFPMRIGRTFDLEQVFPETMVKEARRLMIAEADATEIVDRTLQNLSVALDATAERMSSLDRNGIITRTVDGIRKHSALMKPFIE
ncbi:HipA domain-containing protein [Bifidobacterium amazonense]|uniref:HipA domain-containing protein n=1 Tax=Bifidobacterium amazonense TaxID=2809027 RepID=A0ABS9VWR2_9BIFI|nr:HipA domain-containing protein [Bifidobacterium amazonense]